MPRHGFSFHFPFLIEKTDFLCGREYSKVGKIARKKWISEGMALGNTYQPGDNMSCVIMSIGGSSYSVGRADGMHSQAEPGNEGRTPEVSLCR
jgi:hypothetical protein